MFHDNKFKNTVLATVIGAVAMAIPASATITFDGSSSISNTFQQTQNNPCVIGDPSCNEPAGMTYTSNTGPGDYDLTSPMYTATSPFTTFFGNLIPTTFRIGIDSNIATGAGLQVLDFFRTYDCGTTGSSCSIDSANSFETNTNLPNNNNGNGYSDATLNGFVLTAGHKYQFRAAVINATDGMEEFFLIPLTSSPIPEPVTSALVGLGLVSLFFLKRRATR
ncbi:MAG TPA: PEP-CTERM sorting domain-containing protein [Bryobacteraceae bacterium]|nr:PEP-CTERM sorting domain-containing protein [Bryobacteraceae bacterium]